MKKAMSLHSSITRILCSFFHQKSLDLIIVDSIYINGLFEVSSSTYSHYLDNNRVLLGSFSPRLTMAPVTFNTHSIKRAKRQLFKFNLGGSEHVPRIDGNQNQINYHGGPKTLEEPTLLRHTGDQVRKLIEGGTDVVLAPAKWLAHMQENWYATAVCKLIRCGHRTF